MFYLSIPEISDEELKKRYERIKPVITVDGKLHYFRKYTFEELSSISYLWEAYKDVREEVVENKLVTFREFVCLHRYSCPFIFYPTIKEVLAQIREYDLFASAFEIIDISKSISESNKDSFESIALANNCHVSTVRLYMDIKYS